jgi:hypothetical protein
VHLPSLFSRARTRKSRCLPHVEALECRQLLSSGPSGGFTADQIEQAYGIKQIPGPAHQLPGAGQTIAIFEVGYNSKFVDSSDPSFGTSDLAVFDQAMNLSDPPSFTVIGYNPETGAIAQGVNRAQNPTVTPRHEYALDVEWAHAAAPGAKIIVVEELPPTNPTNDQMALDHAKTLQFAASLPGVSAVSNSFGQQEGTLTNPTAYDSYLQTPDHTYDLSTMQTTPGHAGVTFLAASGDEPGTGGTHVWAPRWPSISPNVVSVGGTALTLDASNNYASETAWDFSQGGLSASEAAPSYQAAVNTTGKRLVPDVAALASPTGDMDGTTALQGADVYDTLNANGWLTTGGTSLAAPIWAGIIADANTLRADYGLPALDGVSQTLPLLYQLPSGDFHPITSVQDATMLAPNDARANPTSLNANYNEYTGRGTPLANLVVRDLAGVQFVVGLASPAAVGVPETLTVSAEDPFGNLAIHYVGTAHFTSTDPIAVLPADYTFLGTDAGTHTLTAMLGTLGPQTVTAADPNHPWIAGSTTVAVSPAPLVATGLTLVPAAHQLYQGPVATFTDANTFRQAGDFSAFIAWGDGSTSAGSVVGSGGSYTVLGSHVYTHPGEYVAKFIVSGGGSGAVASTSVLAQTILPDGSRGTPNQQFVDEALWALFGQPPTLAQVDKYSHKLGANHRRFLTTLFQSPAKQKQFLEHEIFVLYASLMHQLPSAGQILQGVHGLEQGKSLDKVVGKWPGAPLAVLDEVLSQVLTFQYLGHPATPADVALDTPRLHHGGKMDALATALIDSPTFYLHATIG